MTISKRIRSQLFVSTEAPVMSATSSSTDTTSRSQDATKEERVLIRLPLTRPLHGARKRTKASAQPLHGGLGWSDDEHERFLRGLEIFPSGPWKKVAAFVGTRTTRQVMTHAQKYRQKIARRQRGLLISARASAVADRRNEEKAAAEAVATTAITPKLKPVAPWAAELPVSMDATFALALAAASPSSTDQLLHAFYFQTQASAALQQPPPLTLSDHVAMTVDEFKLIDELFAEPSWAMISHLDSDDSGADALRAPWAAFECQL